MAQKLNWGIVGLGNIARTFAHDLNLFGNATLYGVASGNPERAKKFREEFGSVKHYESYESLTRDPQIDIVYIATPHTSHFENAMSCLRAGKSVLCEKPMGMNFREVKALTDEAKARNLFLMEAIWTRFMPSFDKTLELIRDHTIGEINYLRADFGFKGDTNPERRIYNKKLGGGSLLDVGIYPIFLSMMILGLPTKIQATARMTATQVDGSCMMLFDYENGEKAVLESSIECKTPTEARIYGKTGTLKLHSSFHHAKKITLSKDNAEDEIINLDYIGNGYVHEIEEVTQCLINGKIESTKLPHSLSLNLISLMDQVREIIGLSYDE